MKRSRIPLALKSRRVEVKNAKTRVGMLLRNCKRLHDALDDIIEEPENRILSSNRGMARIALVNSLRFLSTLEKEK